MPHYKPLKLCLLFFLIFLSSRKILKKPNKATITCLNFVQIHKKVSKSFCQQNLRYETVIKNYLTSNAK